MVSREVHRSQKKGLMQPSRMVVLQFFNGGQALWLERSIKAVAVINGIAMLLFGEGGY